MLISTHLKCRKPEQRSKYSLSLIHIYYSKMLLNKNLEEQVEKNHNLPHILCFHSNSTPYLQLIKLINSKDFELERVLFPQERLMFTAVPEAQLEITTCKQGSPGKPERISCDRLQVEVCESHSYSHSIAS